MTINDRSTHEAAFEGAFTVDGEMHHVKLVDTYARQRHEDDAALPPKSERPIRHRLAQMIIYRDSDRKIVPSLKKRSDDTGDDHSNHICGTDELKSNTMAYMPKSTKRMLHKRAGGCPTSRKVLSMVRFTIAGAAEFRAWLPTARIPIIKGAKLRLLLSWVRFGIWPARFSKTRSTLPW